MVEFTSLPVLLRGSLCVFELAFEVAVSGKFAATLGCVIGVAS